MKKLIVLSLVLAVVGLASASLSLVGAGNTASVMSGADGATSFLIGWSAGLDPVVSNGLSTGVAGLNLSSEEDLGVDTAENFGLLPLAPASLVHLIFASAADSAVIVPAGEHYSVVFGLGAGQSLGATDMGLGAVYLLNDAGDELLGAAYVVPEPMTMGLLSLGALFLRKRK